jgi:hypothetical protein
MIAAASGLIDMTGREVVHQPVAHRHQVAAKHDVARSDGDVTGHGFQRSPPGVVHLRIATQHTERGHVATG